MKKRSETKPQSMAANATEIEQTLGALLRTPYHILLRRVYEELARSAYAEIRPAHSAVFRNISPGGSWIIELAEKAQMTKQSMSYLVDYLLEHGFVDLRPDPSDRRAKCVHLTEKGRHLQQAAMKISRRIEQQIADEIGDEEMNQFRSLLVRVTEVLQRSESDNPPSAK